jgi:lysophospholipase L1-like esterase
VFLLLEIALRIYDPFHFRVKANKIILPANQKQIITNRINPKLDSIIVNTRNQLGFRGPDTPRNFAESLSIITVGGSTTECHFLSDEKTWPFRLSQELKHQFPGVWLNNAGLDGHSTFGHQLLLDDYLKKLHPKVILFLTGVNDIENDGPSFYDKLTTKNAYPGLLHFFYNNSEVINVAVNLSRGIRAQKFNNTTQQAKIPGQLGELDMTSAQMRERLVRQKKYTEAYRERLSRIADTCISNNMLPVFLTQPCLYGTGTDSVTGVNLATAKVEEGMNGKLLFDLLSLYNTEVKSVCAQKKVPCIDLATMMPKNSLYYYDQTHYTNEGAQLIAQLVEEKLKEILRTY